MRDRDRAHALYGEAVCALNSPRDGGRAQLCGRRTSRFGRRRREAFGEARGTPRRQRHGVRRDGVGRPRLNLGSGRRHAARRGGAKWSRGELGSDRRQRRDPRRGRIARQQRHPRSDRRQRRDLGRKRAWSSPGGAKWKPRRAWERPAAAARPEAWPIGRRDASQGWQRRHSARRGDGRRLDVDQHIGRRRVRLGESYRLRRGRHVRADVGSAAKGFEGQPSGRHGGQPARCAAPRRALLDRPDAALHRGFLARAAAPSRHGLARRPRDSVGHPALRR